MRQSRHDMPEELSPSEVARRLGTSTRSVQRWIAAGRLPARRVGGRWRVAFDASDAFAPPETQIRSVFIANRGEIAARITRTCDRLGIRAIRPATDGSNAIDLLDIDAVVAAARDAEAEALHPGFGFLAENADFAEAVIEAGIHWIGPPPHAIRTMGDKAAARHLAASIGIPVAAGYDAEDQTDATILAAAREIGVPLLVKPAAGGGGKGMRTVFDLGRLPAELESARREARSSFGDDRLILERLIEGARHVEIQVLFDGHGNGVHLGERDCSTQRRHQKVLEESPSPAVDAALRDRMGSAALALGRAVGYTNAGTCEFLLDDRGAFTFLEMNTRLQVEHPVTELVTGRDLVADQIRVAAGEPLGFAQADVSVGGHAIEVRLYAEDAEAGFLPATGRIERLRWPGAERAYVRVDAGVDEGDEVGARFDPMLAKIVARGVDRADAFDGLTRALDDTLVLGVTTNLRFLRWLVRQPVVRDGQVRTDTLERIWPPDDWAARAVIPDDAWAEAAAELSIDGDDPWSGGWRLNAPRSIRLTADDGSTRAVSVAAPSKTFEAVRSGDRAFIDVAGRSIEFRVATAPDVDRTVLSAGSTGLSGSGPSSVSAPMPGRIVIVHAQTGTIVDAGDPLLTIEAMKMEHVVASPVAGRVADLRVGEGDQVERGQLLATVEP